MATKEPEDDNRSPGVRSPLAFLGLGFEVLVPILLGAYVGYRLDRWLETSPGFLLGGLLLGVVVSLVGFFRAVWPQGGGGEGRDR